MATPAPNPDKLRHQIFSILETNLLFGSARGRVRVLSIDAGAATDGLLAAASLARLESHLRRLSGDPSAHISDFFDLAAGAGAGGVLVSLLFSRDHLSRPLLSASDALLFLADNRRRISRPSRRGFLDRIRRRKGPFDELLDDLTLRDTSKPVLIACHDAGTGSPFVFSRADAMETDGYDFKMRDVCAAAMGTCAGEAVLSVDGMIGIAAAAGDAGAVTGNPAAVAVTHVLNNRMEFPAAEGVEDLLLVSIGNGEGGAEAAGIARIAGDGLSDLVDQAVAMAFGSSKVTNYVRIQGREPKSPKVRSSRDSSELLRNAEEMLEQRSVESVLFRGKKLTEKTNSEKLEWLAQELIKEHERRKNCPIPIVKFKQPHTSSSTSNTSSRASSP